MSCHVRELGEVILCPVLELAEKTLQEIILEEIKDNEGKAILCFTQIISCCFLFFFFTLMRVMSACEFL